MRDRDCVEFLQWALPEMGFRWPGFRKVRRQVCRRIQKRLTELELPNLRAYRGRLAKDPDEWEVLDSFCRITISRFHRDRVFFERLTLEVLPELAERAAASGRRELRMWSAGCGAGEEPYTLAMIARLARAPSLVRLRARILGTDANPHQLDRAATGIYEAE